LGAGYSVTSTLWVPKTHPRHATWAYSCISPEGHRNPRSSAWPACFVGSALFLGRRSAPCFSPSPICCCVGQSGWRPARPASCTTTSRSWSFAINSRCSSARSAGRVFAVVSGWSWRRSARCSLAHVGRRSSCARRRCCAGTASSSAGSGPTAATPSPGGPHSPMTFGR